MSDKLTQSAKQTLVFFEEFIRKEEVADFIKLFRKELNLPPEGIIFTDEDKKAMAKPYDAFFYIPQRTRLNFKPIDRKKPMRVINTCNIFTRQQGVNSLYIATLLRLYVFFNQTIDTTMRMFNHWDDFLKLEHIPSELSWFSDTDHTLLKYAYEHFEGLGKKYPIALYINPEASQRQIQDFIAKNWSFIQAYKKDKKINIYRKKKKQTQERNDFIYKNRHFPRKQIMMMITDKFGAENTIDYGYIGKIISIEKKRRENK